jgi:hypothetical protein
MKEKELVKQYAIGVLLNLGIFTVGMLIALAVYFAFHNHVQKQSETPIEYSAE